MIQGMVPPWSSTNMGRLYLLRFRRRSGGAGGSRSRCYINNVDALLVSKGSC